VMISGMKNVILYLYAMFPLLYVKKCSVKFEEPIPVAVRSKAWVYARSLARIAGSNPTRGRGCLSVVSVVCCQVKVSATS
jgi:hypothetical protein